MPNWSFNTIAVRGTKQQVINFLNEGLKRSHGRKKSFSPIPDNATTERIVEAFKTYKLSLRSWLPMPRTFKQWDTTNSLRTFEFWLENQPKVNLDWEYIRDHIEELKEAYGDKYKEYCDGYQKAKQYQMENYGIVGWYDYNCATLGTKWDSSIESWKIVSDDENKFLLTFYCATAWSLPTAWIYTMQQKHKDMLFGCYATEESYSYAGFIDGHDVNDWVENHEYDEVLAQLKEEKPDLDQDSDEAYEIASELYNDLCDKIYDNFIIYMQEH